MITINNKFNYAMIYIINCPCITYVGHIALSAIPLVGQRHSTGQQGASNLVAVWSHLMEMV